MSWETRLLRTREMLDPVRFLGGDWIGEGQAHGEPITATMAVRSVLGDTMIEVRETVGEHTDVAYYRFDVDTGQHRVLHLMAGAMVEDHAVELLPDGFVWVTPPTTPAVEWRLDGEGLRCDVVWPGQRVAEVSVRYRRA